MINSNDPNFEERAVRRIRQDAARANWSLRQSVALACRILAEDGHGYGLAGQITARGERPGTFYTQRLGFGFHEMTASSLLLVDENLEVLEGAGMPNPANRFHAWVYHARPDVQCVIHTHPFHVSALAMIEEPLVISHMDTCILYNDCAFLPSWPGLPFGDDEGEIIASALGAKRALLLGHHGQLSACRSVEEATLISMAMERAAKLQLAAQAAGKIIPLEAASASKAHDWLINEDRVGKVFDFFSRQALKFHSDCLQ